MNRLERMTGVLKYVTEETRLMPPEEAQIQEITE